MDGISHLCRIEDYILNVSDVGDSCSGLLGAEAFLKDGLHTSGPTLVVEAIMLCINCAEQILEKQVNT